MQKSARLKSSAARGPTVAKGGDVSMRWDGLDKGILVYLLVKLLKWKKPVFDFL